jgi:hypothetical protein
MPCYFPGIGGDTVNIIARIALVVLMLGWGFNTLVMMSNGDRMPVLSSCKGDMCEDYRHVLIDENTAFAALGDVLVWHFPHHTLYYSIGDVCMVLGLPAFTIAEILGIFLLTRQYLRGNGKGQ